MIIALEPTETMLPVEQEVHMQAVQATASTIADYLQHLLGQRITADMAGTRDPKAVGKWARHEQDPRPTALTRLRTAYQIALLLERHYTRPAVRAWFVQMNPYLDQYAPASRIGADPRGVYHAARAFVRGY